MSIELNSILLLIDQVFFGSIYPLADNIEAMFTIWVGLKSFTNDANQYPFVASS